MNKLFAFLCLTSIISLHAKHDIFIKEKVLEVIAGKPFTISKLIRGSNWILKTDTNNTAIEVVKEGFHNNFDATPMELKTYWTLIAKKPGTYQILVRAYRGPRLQPPSFPLPLPSYIKPGDTAPRAEYRYQIIVNS